MKPDDMSKEHNHQHHHPHSHPTQDEYCKYGRDPFKSQLQFLDIECLAELKRYILTQLGSPVICVELSDEQMMGVIADCIRYFWKYYKGSQREDYLCFELQPGITHYKICQELEEVVNFECSNWFGDINHIFTPMHNLMYSEMMSMGGMQFNSTCWGGSSYGDVLGHWNGMLTWLEEAKNEFSTTYSVRYIRESKELSVWPTPQHPERGLIRVFKREHIRNIIQDPLFRKMVVSRCGMIWTNALRKYQLTLAGGGTLNADSLYSSYEKEHDWCIERIDKESPNGEFFVG